MIKTRLIKMLSHARKYIVYQVLWQWVTLVAQIVLMYAVVHLLWGAYGEMTQGVTFEGGNYMIMVAIAGAVRFVANRRAAKASFEASVDVKRILRDRIYEKLLRLGASYREQVPTSEIVQLAGEGVEQLETYFGKFLSQFFYSLIAPLTLFIVLFHVSWKASLVLLVCVPLIPGVIMMVQKIAKRLLSKYWDIYAGLGDSFLENLQGMTTLKIYRADAKKAEQMDYESEQFRIITMKVLQMQLNSIIIMDAIAYGGAALGMIITISGYLHGEIDFPGALWIILLAVEFFLPMRMLGSFFHVAMNGMAASDKIFRLLDLPEPEEKGGVIPEGALDIEIRDICFSYEKGDSADAASDVRKDGAAGSSDVQKDGAAGSRDVLTGVSMEFPAGSFTSLVGASGCGKSTIAGILMGRNRGYRGSVTVGGLELSEINERSLMDHITLVSNNSHLFKGTVKENLMMGHPGADEERLIEVLRLVNLDGFIFGRQGLDTEIAENGSNLSGGQRQRLALARALLHDTPVYIFDEATSNIDSESEEMIMSVIHRLARTRTIILISHRLANVVSSDCIYMLEGGRVCQSGTHEGLMAAGGAYRELYERQRELEAYGRGQTPGDLGSDPGRFGERPRAIWGQTPGDLGPDPGRFGVRPRGKKGQTPGQKGSDPDKRRPGLVIMGQLIGLVKPLLPVMLISVTLGVAGFLCAISLTILASGKLLEGIGEASSLATGTFFAVLFVVAVLRGVLHYGEQYCNHFIAFKLLAIIRHKVFANLRRLCPARLEGKDRGNLISIITSDIELLEVFYAHTISPIAIAAIVSLIMTVFIGRQDPWAGLLALCAYVTVGVLIPLAVGKAGGDRGLAFRNKFGELNSFVLDSIRGIDETIQYADGESRRKEIGKRSLRLSRLQRRLANLEAAQTSVTYIATLLFSFGMLFLMLYEYREGRVTYANALTATVSMMGSFGPVMALSNLANSLNQTLASGERVLSILEEEPQVAEVTNGKDLAAFTGAGAHGVTFAYGNGEENDDANAGLSQEYILSDYTLEIPKGKVVGIYGASGSGKSTLLRLLMRFWDVTGGQIELSGTDVREINTTSLRNTESYVEQETYLFHDSIANNIAIGKLDATREEIMEAAKKASIHDFIMTLPNGYDTEVGELGDTLSGGERQRIGIARAFLHDAPLLLLDEPTSNLDSLNEGIILKSLAETMASEDRTVVLVSHRKSTLSMADVAYRMESGRLR